MRAPAWVNELAERWRDDARRRAMLWPADPLAAVLPRLADELEAEAQQFGTTSLTIRQAAEESGYSEAHLREMVREGKLPLAAPEGPYRIRRENLPLKPGTRRGATETSTAAQELRRAVRHSRNEPD